MNNYKLISWVEAEEQYGLRSKVNRQSIPSEYLTDKLVAVYSGDLEVDTLIYEDTYFSHFENQDVIGFVVEGDLRISQYADLGTSDVGFGAHVLVQGNLIVKALWISGMSEFYIEKETIVSDFIIGNDLGYLTCNGDLQAKHVYIKNSIFRLNGSLTGVLYVDNYKTSVNIPESEEEKIVWVMDVSDVPCIYSEELEDAEDDDDINDEEFERLVNKYIIFVKPFWNDDEILQCFLNGDPVFRDIDMQNL